MCPREPKWAPWIQRPVALGSSGGAGGDGECYSRETGHHLGLSRAGPERSHYWPRSFCIVAISAVWPETTASASAFTSAFDVVDRT